MPEGKKKREIQPVEGRSDKQRTYQEQIRRYKKAMQNGFFCEAIVIDYACMEDRLRYMLYYLGVLQNEDDISIKGKSSRVNEFRAILREYEGDKENLGIGTIAGKRKIIRSVFRMASEPVKPKTGKALRQLLWTALHHEQHDGEILQILQDIEDWCKYRNEIIHSLLNKNLDSLNERIAEKAEEGFQLFRRLDNRIQWVKRKKIREKLGLKSGEGEDN